MDVGTSFGLAGAGLAVGVALGWVLARGRGAAAPAANAAGPMMQQEIARLQAALAAVEARAKRDVAALQAEMTTRVEKLDSEHRAEQEKLARHLTEAYDELDALRANADAAKGIRPGDTGYGFAKTLPLGDL